MGKDTFLHMRPLCMALLSLLVLATAACDQPTQSNAVPDAQPVLRVASWSPGNDLQSLDPAGDRPRNPLFPYSEQVVTLLYARLTDLDTGQRPALSAANSVKVSPDGLTYTFTLRPRLRFGDGAAITSADVAYSLNRALSPCALPPSQTGAITNTRRMSSFAWALLSIKDSSTFNAERCNANGSIQPNGSQQTPPMTTLIGDSIRTPDPTTLVLTLDHPDSDFLLNLARPIASIVDQRLIRLYGDSWTMHLADSSGKGTSGMYTVQFIDTDLHGLATKPGSYIVASKGITLVRSHTWALTPPRLREIQIVFPLIDHFRDAYLANQIDVIPTYTGPPSLDQARHDPGYHEAPMPSLDYIALNWHKPPFNDLRVRQALALALDKNQIAHLAFWGTAQPTNHLVPEGVSGYNASLTGPLGVTTPAGNPAKAKALWLSYVADICDGDAGKCPEAYLAGGGCHTPAIPDNMAQFMLTNWRQAMPGFRVSFTGNLYPSCVLFANQPPTPPCLWRQLVRFSWDTDLFQQRAWLSPLFDPTDPQYAFADPNDNSNRCTQDDPAIALLHAAAQEQDTAARTRLYQSAEQQLVDDVAVIPLYQYRASWEVRPNVLHYPTTYRPWISQSEWAAIYLSKI